MTAARHLLSARRRWRESGRRHESSLGLNGEFGQVVTAGGADLAVGNQPKAAARPRSLMRPIPDVRLIL